VRSPRSCPRADGARHWRALALAVDGSIVQAQFRSDPDTVIRDLRHLVAGALL
jgi:hypothetical protein